MPNNKEKHDACDKDPAARARVTRRHQHEAGEREQEQQIGRLGEEGEEFGEEEEHRG